MSPRTIGLSDSLCRYLFQMGLREPDALRDVREATSRLPGAHMQIALELACKGAEKAFVSFAERISREWEDDARRDLYGDDWFKSAVAKVILFKTTERIISEASWYEGGYRAQIAAYTCARLAKLGLDQSNGGGLDCLSCSGEFETCGERVFERTMLQLHHF